MKSFWIVLWYVLAIHASEIDAYATVGILSHHFSSDDEGDPYNDTHKAYGAEILFDQRYAISYLHMINSRNKTTDIGAVGYRYNFYGPFGVYGVVGYQHGYCFDGLKSVECTEGKDNSGIAFMPMLYYQHDYFIIDLITQGSMIALKFNIKLF